MVDSLIKYVEEGLTPEEQKLSDEYTHEAPDPSIERGQEKAKAIVDNVSKWGSNLANSVTPEGFVKGTNALAKEYGQAHEGYREDGSRMLELERLMMAFPLGVGVNPIAEAPKGALRAGAFRTAKNIPEGVKPLESAYTTPILESVGINSKGQVSLKEIQNLLNRSNVTAGEKQMLGSYVDEAIKDGWNKTDLNAVKQDFDTEIGALTERSASPKTQYARYTNDSSVIPDDFETYSAPQVATYDAPNNIPGNLDTHYGPNNVAHTRFFDNLDTGDRYIIEAQSDFYQKNVGNVTTPNTITRDMIRDVVELQYTHGIIDDVEAARLEDFFTNDNITNFLQEYNTREKFKEAWEAAIKADDVDTRNKFGAINDVIEDNGIDIFDTNLIKEPSQDVKALVSMKKRWHEKILQEEVHTALDEGLTSVNIPTLETANKVEGWVPIPKDIGPNVFQTPVSVRGIVNNPRIRDELADSESMGFIRLPNSQYKHDIPEYQLNNLAEIVGTYNTAISSVHKLRSPQFDKRRNPLLLHEISQFMRIHASPSLLIPREVRQEILPIYQDIKSVIKDNYNLDMYRLIEDKQDLEFVMSKFKDIADTLSEATFYPTVRERPYFDEIKEKLYSSDKYKQLAKFYDKTLPNYLKERYPNSFVGEVEGPNGHTYYRINLDDNSPDKHSTSIIRGQGVAPPITNQEEKKAPPGLDK